MRFDIRFPIGLIFVLIGAIIAIYGLTSNPEIYNRSLGININLWWGAVMFLFGVLMLLLAWRARRRSA